MKAAWCAVLGIALAGTAAAQSHSDREFLEKASQGNVAEVELGKLALRKTTNPDVRAFAQHMIRDHRKLGEQMAPLIANAGIKPSVSLNTEHQHLFKRLNGLPGTDFDKEYVKAMDEDHHEDLKDFGKEVDSTQVPTLRAAVSSGEKIIAEHTHMADALSRKMGLPLAS